MSGLKNIPLKTFRDYLIHCGLHHIRTKGGHEVWSAKGLTRPAWGGINERRHTAGQAIK
jgi:hypothetical protein